MNVADDRIGVEGLAGTSSRVIRNELAAAIAAVNSAFRRLDPADQAHVEIVVDGHLDSTVLAGEPDAARIAIGDWLERQLAAIDGVQR